MRVCTAAVRLDTTTILMLTAMLIGLLYICCMSARTPASTSLLLTVAYADNATYLPGVANF